MQVLEFVTCWAALWSHFCPASCWHSVVILQYRETHIPQTWRVPLFVLKVITPATKEQCTSVVCKVATLAPRVFIYTLSSWQQWRKIWLRIGPGKSLLSCQWWSFSYLSAGRAEQWGSLLSVAVPQCPPAWWSCSCSGGPVEWIKHTPKGEEEKETLVLLWVNSSVHCVCVMFSFSYQ